ncbi:MAG: hypothetical protein ASARMPREDX12_002934 [Alectoria sarmentosa]|nr:MAG: hypothetical protein ASARMPREDX12_002934 [Alectoria sarmentosa]
MELSPKTHFPQHQMSSDCNPCQIIVAFEGLFRIYWYSSTLGLTLDTVSEAITKYNNTAITSTTTIYGNLNSVNSSTVTEASSIAMAEIDPEQGNDYDMADFFLGNATNGLVDGPVSIPYPVPYLAISAFQYLTATSGLQGCPAGFDEGIGPGGCSCIMESVAAVQVAQSTNSYEVAAFPVSLTSTFYQVLNSHPVDNDLSDMRGANLVIGTFDTASFSTFLSSASAFKSYPALRSCAIYVNYNGPPALMIPVAALTTTIKTTVAGVGPYNPPTPKPVGPIKQTIAPQTARAPSPTPTVQVAEPPAPPPKVSIPILPGIPTDSPFHFESSNVPSPNFPEAPTISPGTLAGPSILPIVNPPATAELQAPAPIAKPVLTFAGSTYIPDESSNIQIAGHTLKPGSAAAVIANTPISLAPGGMAAIVGTSTHILATLASPAVLTFAGSVYTADASSNIVVAGSTIKPGGAAIVLSGTTISLVPGGAAAVVGTSTEMLTGATSIDAASTPVQTIPALTFGGSTYLADQASRFVIAGETVTPGGVITVSSTLISIAPGADFAVVGSSTQSLLSAAVTPKPVLTFGGSTYIAGDSTDFAIDGKTLTKGGTVNVGGTQMSLDQAGKNVVIGTSTQTLGTTSAVVQEPVVSFGGSIYSADSSSNFIIGSQTLTEVGVITVEGTPISYAAAGTDVVVGTSTEAVGLGGYIMSGLGAGPPTSAPVLFSGRAVRKSVAPWTLCLISGILTAVYLRGR